MKHFMMDFGKHVALLLLAIGLVAMLGATWKNDQYVNREQSLAQDIAYLDGVSDTYVFPVQVKHVEVRYITAGSTGKCNFDFRTAKQDPTLDGSHENYVDASYLIEHVDINATEFKYRGNGGDGNLMLYATW